VNVGVLSGLNLSPNSISQHRDVGICYVASLAWFPWKLGACHISECRSCDFALSMSFDLHVDTKSIVLSHQVQD